MLNHRQKTINGMLWSISERFSLQGVQLVVSIILARLLEPSQFGLIGMLSLFMALAQSILDSGFGSALIQKKDVDHLDNCSIFYFNILVGIFLTLLLIAFAPVIAAFFDQPILIPLTRFLSLNIFINGFALVQSTILTKQMNFKAQLKINLISVVLSGMIGITLAYLGWGVWSLALQSVLNTLFRTILYWVLSTWKPSLIFSFTALGTMFTFGSKLLLSGLLDTFFQNIYQTFIGKMFSVSELGFYTRARSMEQTAVTATSSSLGRVLFPAMSPLQDDITRLRQAYKKTIGVSLFFHFPLMFGLIGIADPLIRFLMTDKWAPSIPFFQLLCIVGLLYPLQVLNLNILMVKGRSDLFFRLEIIKKIFVILAILITYRWGVTGLIFGQIGTSVISYLLNSYYSGQLVNYSMIEQIRDITPSFITAGLMGLLLLKINSFFLISLFSQVILLTIVGIIVYFFLNWVIKSKDMKESIIVLKSTINSISRKHKHA
jgi:O-antigen/teichoic acid export membrane protein